MTSRSILRIAAWRRFQVFREIETARAERRERHAIASRFGTRIFRFLAPAEKSQFR
jgi:hypothetical protein